MAKEQFVADFVWWVEFMLLVSITLFLMIAVSIFIGLGLVRLFKLYSDRCKRRDTLYDDVKITGTSGDNVQRPGAFDDD